MLFAKILRALLFGSTLLASQITLIQAFSIPDMTDIERADTPDIVRRFERELDCVDHFAQHCFGYTRPVHPAVTRALIIRANTHPKTTVFTALAAAHLMVLDDLYADGKYTDGEFAVQVPGSTTFTTSYKPIDALANP